MCSVLKEIYVVVDELWLAMVKKWWSAYFGDADWLLFHCFVDAGSVVFAHRVELIDAADAAVG